ncbi:LamG domain-containing protein [Muricauda sp. SK9]|uniref:LamG domain-containing protein n=1 Tax=Flavobacteriaceae TaxID=49546 RepID=UPI002349A8C9|nr:LamG domain-containing protein [Muricauda sp. SK9]MDC6384723.1 LamG domain-containing protein [Muricauda sp. SK9]
MKYTVKSIYFLLGLLVVSCNEGIDPITAVDAGVDETAPLIVINKPIDGFQLKVPEAVAAITIDFEVRDDIEISTVSVAMDGTEIASYTGFLDYRYFIKDDLVYDNVTTGVHTLTITATDIDGKTTTSSIDFEKTPPYVPIYDGEMFYMPFDGDFNEQVTITAATEVGSPSLVGGVSGNAYQGAADSYLRFPSADLAKGNEFSATFWLKVDPSDTRAGIINIAPAEPASPSDKPSGFGLIREGSADAQKFILLVGNGTNATWVNPGVPATIDPTLEEWVHFGISISATNAALYMNGELVGETAFTGIDWTGVGDLVIMSGDPNFNGWDHKTEKGQMDELRLFNKALSQQEIQKQVTESSSTFYLPFDGSYTDVLSGENAAEVGSPSLVGGISGNAYQGAADSYLTFPSADLAQGNEFSATFWLKIDPSDTRAGIINIAPAEPASPSDKPSGFGLIREGSADAQKFILLVGNGTNATWVNPGVPATIDPTLDEWVHFGISISATNAALYMNGELVGETAFTGIDWTGVGDLVIMSGDPNFNGWDHKTEKGQMDELRLYSKALTQQEIQNLIQ